VLSVRTRGLIGMRKRHEGQDTPHEKTARVASPWQICSKICTGQLSRQWREGIEHIQSLLAKLRARLTAFNAAIWLARRANDEHEALRIKSQGSGFRLPCVPFLSASSVQRQCRGGKLRKLRARDKRQPQGPCLFPIGDLQSIMHVVRRIGIARVAGRILPPAATSLLGDRKLIALCPS
jgi:hypothetical protein